MDFRLLSLLLLAATLAGCPKGGPPKDESGAKTLKSSEAQDAGAKGKGTALSSSTPGEIGFATDEPRACMYHPGAKAYFLCLTGSDGTCFHYGATCTPQSSCMYDEATQSHRLCKSASEGVCTAFSSPCTPPKDCSFDPAEGRYRICQAPKDGRCKGHGNLCEPPPGS